MLEPTFVSQANLDLIHSLQKELRSRANPARAKMAAAYMKVALPFVGVEVPEVRRLTGRTLAEYPIEAFGEYQATLRRLFFDATYQEERYAALAIAGNRRSARFQKPRMLPLYRRMITTAAWWDLVDELSTRVGDVLDGDHAATTKVLLAWAHHENIWLRRAAIICQRKLGERMDLSLLYACIEPSLGESEFFLRKGIGWALRSLAWSNPEETIRYVKANRSRLSPLSKKEALKNLLKSGAIDAIP